MLAGFIVKIWSIHVFPQFVSNFFMTEFDAQFKIKWCDIKSKIYALFEVSFKKAN